MLVKNMSYRQRKFLQRFLAVIAAFVLIGSEVFVPSVVQHGQVLAFVPSPDLQVIQGGLSVVEDAVEIAAPEAAASGGIAAALSTAAPVLIPLAIGGVAVGVAYYAWNNTQNGQLISKAQQAYCKKNANLSVCTPSPGTPGWNVTITGYSTRDVTLDGKPISPSSVTVFIPLSSSNSSGNFTLGFTQYSSARYNGVWANVYSIDISGTCVGCLPATYGYNDVAETHAITNVTPVNQFAPWSQWSPDAQQQALNTLTDTDVTGIINQLPSAGTLTNGQILPKGAVIRDPNLNQGKPFVTNAPYTVGSGKPVPGDPAKNQPHKFPPALDQGLTQKQKDRLQQRINVGNLTGDQVDKGKFRAIPNDPYNRKCFYTELGVHLGNYKPHSDYATEVTGSQSDLFMVTPNGEFANYDGALRNNGTAIGAGEKAGAVAEVKTNQDWLIDVVNNIPLNDYDTEEKVKLEIQLYYQALVARVCQLRYFIAFAKQNVATIAGPMLQSKYPPARVHYIPFNQSSLLENSTAKPLATELTPPQTTSPVAQHSAKGEFAAVLEVLLNKHDNNQSELADNQFVTEGQSSQQKASQLSKSTPTGGQRDLGGWNNGEADGRHSELTPPEQQTRTRQARPTALALSR